MASGESLFVVSVLLQRGTDLHLATACVFASGADHAVGSFLGHAHVTDSLKEGYLVKEWHVDPVMPEAIRQAYAMLSPELRRKDARDGADALALLRKLEWCDVDSAHCPVCFVGQDHGSHEPNCDLARLIGAKVTP